MLIEFGKDAFVREPRKLKKKIVRVAKSFRARAKKEKRKSIGHVGFSCPASVPSVVGGQHFCDILLTDEELYTHSIVVLIQNSKKSRS
jgi:hypothetical protein